MSLLRLYVMILSLLTPLLSLEVGHAQEGGNNHQPAKCITVGDAMLDKLLKSKPRSVCVGDKLLYVPYNNGQLKISTETLDYQGIGYAHPNETFLEDIDAFAFVKAVFPQSRRLLVRFNGENLLISTGAVAGTFRDWIVGGSRNKFGISITECTTTSYLCAGSTFQFKDRDGQTHNVEVLGKYTNGLYDVKNSWTKEVLHYIAVIIPNKQITQTLHTPGMEGTAEAEVSCLTFIAFPLQKVSICKGDTVVDGNQQVFHVVKVFSNKTIQVSNDKGGTITLPGTGFRILK